MDKVVKVSYLSLIVIVEFAASVSYHYVQGVYFGRPYPQNTFLFDPAERGGDFSDVLRDGHTLNPYLQFSSAQYPFLALVGFAFSLLGGSAYPAFLAIITVPACRPQCCESSGVQHPRKRHLRLRGRLPLLPLLVRARSRQLRVACVRASSGVSVLLHKRPARLGRAVLGPRDRVETLSSRFPRTLRSGQEYGVPRLSPLPSRRARPWAACSASRAACGPMRPSCSRPPISSPTGCSASSRPSPATWSSAAWL